MFNKRLKSKFLSIFIAIAMVLTIMPMTATSVQAAGIDIWTPETSVNLGILAEGYSEVEYTNAYNSASVTVVVPEGSSTDDLTITRNSGDDAFDYVFNYSASSPTRTDFRIKPKTGLTNGTYNATYKFSGAGFNDKLIDVTFKVADRETGDFRDNPYGATSFAQLKTALEGTQYTYVEYGNNAAHSETVNTGSDIQIVGTKVLMLNGVGGGITNMVTSNTANLNNLFVVGDGADLTVTSGHSQSWRFYPYSDGGSIFKVKGGKLTLGGNVYDVLSDDSSKTYHVLNASGGEVTLNGTWISTQLIETSPDARTVKLSGTADVNITGGRFTYSNNVGLDYSTRGDKALDISDSASVYVEHDGSTQIDFFVRNFALDSSQHDPAYTLHVTKGDSYLSTWAYRVNMTDGGTARTDDTTASGSITAHYGEEVTIEGDDAENFGGWDSDDVYFADKKAFTTTFTMPDKVVDITKLDGLPAPVGTFEATGYDKGIVTITSDLMLSEPFPNGIIWDSSTKITTSPQEITVFPGEKNVVARKNVSGNIITSLPLTFNIIRAETPTNLTAGVGSISGVNDGMEYSVLLNNRWTDYFPVLAGATTIEGLLVGKYRVRTAASGHELASEHIQVEVTETDAAEIKINGNTILGTTDDLLNDGGSVKYDAPTNTVTLTNAHLNESGGINPYSATFIAKTTTPLTIHLVGDSTITQEGNIYANGDGLKVFGGGDLNITGDGTLIVDQTRAENLSPGVQVLNGGDFNMSSGTLTIKSSTGSSGLDVREKTTLSGDADVTVIIPDNMGTSGAYFENGLTLSDTANLTVSGGITASGSNQNAVYVWEGDLKVEDKSTLTAKSSNVSSGARGYGIVAAESDIIISGGTVIAEGGEAYNEKPIVSGSTINITAGDSEPGNTITDYADPSSTYFENKYVKIVSTPPTYGMSIEPGGSATYTVDTNYTPEAEAVTYTLENTNNGAITGISVALTGADADKFTLDTSTMNRTLVQSGTTTFTVTPTADLPIGDYVVEIAVTANETYLTIEPKITFKVVAPIETVEFINLDDYTIGKNQTINLFAIVDGELGRVDELNWTLWEINGTTLLNTQAAYLNDSASNNSYKQLVIDDPRYNSDTGKYESIIVRATSASGESIEKKIHIEENNVVMYELNVTYGGPNGFFPEGNITIVADKRAREVFKEWIGGGVDFDDYNANRNNRISQVFLDDNPLNMTATYTEIAGVNVTGQVTSYNPKLETNITLTGTGSEGVFTAKIEALATGSGQQTQGFTIPSVPAGTYNLVVEKGGHLDYTINGVVVESSDLDLKNNGKSDISDMRMIAGNMNGDNNVNFDDLRIVVNASNYNKSSSASGVNANANVNGDGNINFDDLRIVVNASNYNKSITDCTLTYNP